MSPFTVSDRECISSLKISTSPYYYFSWGGITLLVLTRLATLKLSYSTYTIFGNSSLCPTLRLCFTPTPHTACSLHHPNTPSKPDPCPILTQHHKCSFMTTNN